MLPGASTTSMFGNLDAGLLGFHEALWWALAEHLANVPGGKARQRETSLLTY